MFDLDRLEEIWATIARNKWRSFMTAMSVFWAVLMLIVMSGSGIGFKRMLMDEVKMPTNSALIAASITDEPYKGYKSGRWWSMTLDDAHNIKSSFPEIINAESPIEVGDKTISHKDFSSSFSVRGSSPTAVVFDQPNLIFGRYINTLDIQRSRQVCVIGKSVYEAMFPMRENPIGESVNVGGSAYTIIGVQEQSSNMINLGTSINSVITIPMSTAVSMFTQDNNISYIIIEVDPKYDVDVVANRVKEQLFRTHKISPTDKKALMVVNVSNIFKIFESIFGGIRLLIWIVGLGSLFAGIIGVSNIMLIVIKERTQEIGVRRALGAKPFSIISQVMSESFLLTFIAGVFGMAVSVGILSLAESILAAQATDPLSQIPAFSPQVTFEFALVAAGLVLVSGLLSGVIPALRAMAIKPVDAIREE